MKLSMSKSRLVLGLAVLSMASSASAEHTRVTNPNALSVEVLGRCMAYCFNYDRVMDDNLAAGFGLGWVPTRIGNTNTGNSANLIAPYANYYFMKEQGSLFATAGVTIVTNTGTVQGTEARSSGLDFNSNPIIPTFGVGYENRGDAGFLFRVAGYGLVAGSFAPWFGIGFGYSF